jgi:hypothetical protein
MLTSGASESHTRLVDRSERGESVSSRTTGYPGCGDPQEPSVEAVGPQQNPFLLSGQATISLGRYRPTSMLIAPSTMRTVFSPVQASLKRGLIGCLRRIRRIRNLIVIDYLNSEESSRRRP